MRLRISTRCYTVTSKRKLTTGLQNRLSNVFIPPYIASRVDGGMVIPFFQAESRLGTRIASQTWVSASGTRNVIRKQLIVLTTSGIYHVLPLGLRVQEKIERIINITMASLCASKLSLSTLSSSKLWKQTGRWEKYGQELFRLTDRKSSEFCLCPTHEEEITNLIANEILSYRQLPLRLYQIGRKFRDEKRPRGGLLRGREFLMNDLYTFDASEAAAMQTYDAVQAAYYRLFKTIGVPFVVAEAESGNIGGDKSHEYHYLSSSIPEFGALLTIGGEDKVLVCERCNYAVNTERSSSPQCLQCGSQMHEKSAIEVGHTFHLGTRYSEALGAFVTAEDPSIRSAIQMGCHGIGVSRLVVAIADICRGSRGLCWPVSVAPWETVIVTAGQEEGAEQVWDLLKDYTDSVIDDRQKTLGWKLKDAEAVGYPVTVIVGHSKG
ncbi:putative proline--tRNA ligase, mitochondrial [Neolecta irregularis DAH-3]|uniref:proline--tRNA ligase n=1 Tax=Neolecta irregularis (strain DAH-3) TaxID=1198029 RepID=A0A1U7LSF6_NEOID|nr:putative proline--tRNA ligase, mitochondrial [Neolecta irregularis DAH-3]|eukprot:OLL25559.1 putative proline--tRNA ligase, mitochondrial [Neolecta irregularis DAH-3]